MADLINGYAAQGEMLPKSLNQIYQSLRDFVVVEEDGQIVGCGALHIVWDDLAEIRSLAVVEERWGNGLGRQMVTCLLEEARRLGLPTVFALTYRQGFFKKLGFQVVDKDTLPRKVWVDCIDCLKFPHCDETAVVLHLNSNHLRSSG
ncbi:MAG TPA: N-acetyltransferase [Anaerolineae bacterium]|nr:N-acetyltransferase [Anaerolineae bacterium]